MSIAINSQKCIGCGACKNICPGNLIKFNKNQKAYIKYPKDCWGCCSCIKECNNYAINLYLGADIGGRGGNMHTQQDSDIINWIIKDRDGSENVIQIDKKNSNNY